MNFMKRFLCKHKYVTFDIRVGDKRQKAIRCSRCKKLMGYGWVYFMTTEKREENK
jgi:hypothetical protein